MYAPFLALALVSTWMANVEAIRVGPIQVRPMIPDTQWVTYANWNDPYWITWQGPERAVKFNPLDFGIQQPFSIKRVRTEFFLMPSNPWPDSSFRFKLYASNGSTLLYTSPILEAIPGEPGSPVTHVLTGPVHVQSGDFYVSVAPIDPSGAPSSCADDTGDGKSYYGSPGDWEPFELGELFVSAYVEYVSGSVLTPNGGEFWAGGDTQTVSWTVSPKDFFYTKLLLSTDGGSTFPEVIAPSIAPTETAYAWSVPSSNYATCRVKLQCFDSTNALVFEDASNANFTIDSQDPAAPALIYPPRDGAVNMQSVVFRWHRASDNLSGIDYHTIQIAYDSMFGALVDTARRTDTTYARLLPADTSYYWRVRGTDRCGNVGPWSQNWKFEIDVQTPEVPTLLQPVADEWFRSSTVQFHWTPVSFRAPVLSAVRYIIQLDTLQSIRPLYTDTATAVYDTFSFLPEHRYWWRVRAYDLAGNQGVFSASQGFGVDMTGPLIPSLVYPPHLGAITTDTTSLIWHVSRDYTSGTELYHVQLAHDSSFTDTIALTPGPTLPDTAAAASLPSMTDYYWRVRARDTAGNWCNWSLVRQFTYNVGVAEQPDRLPGVAHLECQPNPSSGRTTVRLALPSPTDASVAVYDAMGVKVGELWDGRLPAGRHSFNWDARTSSGRAVVPGVYFVRATAAQWSRVINVRIVR